MTNKRTDLALEARELYQESCEKTTQLHGVKATKRRQEGYGITVVDVLTPHGAQLMDKPQGSYCTIDLTSFWERKPDFFPRAVRVIAHHLSQMLPASGSILVVGLGNRAMTPDAIGPQTVGHLLVTRHLHKEGGLFASFRPVSALAPGVLGTTGMETLEAIRGVVAQVHPSAVIVVDALAARRTERLCNTVQIADTGLIPGSGVGNHRQGLNRDSLGIPVIAVGIPTVVDSVTLCMDALDDAGAKQPFWEHIPHMMVTPQDIDAQVTDLAKLVGYAITYALQPLELEDIGALLG